MIPKEVYDAYIDYTMHRISKKEYQAIYAKHVVFLNSGGEKNERTRSNDCEVERAFSNS